MSLSETMMPRPGRARTPSRARGLEWSPPVVLAFLAMFGLTFLFPLGSKAALMFLTFGLLLALSAPTLTLGGLRQNWMIVAAATWCLASVAWSDYPGNSLRYGIQLCLTVGIGIAIVTRLSPSTFVKTVFVLMSIAAVASLASGRARAGGMGFLGLYGSKNALAAAASVMIIAAVAVLADRRLGFRWRGPAVISLAVSTALLVMGKSTGALVATAGVVMAFLLTLLMQRLRPGARVVALGLMIVLFMFAGIVISTFAEQLAMMFLDATGKDVTLTGRTDLWQLAIDLIRERPLLGTGFQAFWVLGNPPAEDMWAKFGIASKSGFNFHNTPLNNAVEVGIIGVAAQLWVVFGAAYSTITWAVRSHSAASIFLALVMIRILMQMSVEVVFMFQFDIGVILIIAASHYGRGFLRTARAVDAAAARALATPVDAAAAAART